MDNIKIIFYFVSMKKKKTYKFLLRVSEDLKKPLEKVAEENQRSVNSEINIALESHVNKHKCNTKK